MHRIVEQVRPVDQAFGTVVIGKSQHCVAEHLHLQQGRSPAVREVLWRGLGNIGGQVEQEVVRMQGGQPVGGTEGNVPIPMGGSLLRHKGVVQRVQIQRDGFQFDAIDAVGGAKVGPGMFHRKGERFELAHCDTELAVALGHDFPPGDGGL